MTTTTETTIAVPPGTITDGEITGKQEATAVFTAADGTAMPVRITLLQVGDVFAVGVYPTESNGVVLRWHDGPSADPRVIHWSAPRSPEDVCR